MTAMFQERYRRVQLLLLMTGSALSLDGLSTLRVQAVKRDRSPRGEQDSAVPVPAGYVCTSCQDGEGG